MLISKQLGGAHRPWRRGGKEEGERKGKRGGTGGNRDSVWVLDGGG